MSGGYFDYKQFHLNDIVDEMEEVKKKCDIEPETSTDEYHFDESGSLKHYVEDIPQFKTEVDKAIYHLKMAHTMVQRIDWFLSGDDGWDSFNNRLKEEILKIEKK